MRNNGPPSAWTNLAARRAPDKGVVGPPARSGCLENAQKLEHFLALWPTAGPISADACPRRGLIHMTFKPYFEIYVVHKS